MSVVTPSILCETPCPGVCLPAYCTVPTVAVVWCRVGGDKHHAKHELEAEVEVPNKAMVAGGIMKEADSVLDELVRLREWQKEMEHT